MTFDHIIVKNKWRTRSCLSLKKKRRKKLPFTTSSPQRRRQRHKTNSHSHNSHSVAEIEKIWCDSMHGIRVKPPINHVLKWLKI